jgi:hypothetical protein
MYEDSDFDKPEADSLAKSCLLAMVVIVITIVAIILILFL